MQRMIQAVQVLKMDNPLRLPISRTGQGTIPVRGTNVRAALAYQITDREVAQFTQGLLQNSRLRALEGKRYRVLHLIPDNPQDKDGFPLPPQNITLIVYDYSRNQGLEVRADFPRARRVEVREMTHQPFYSYEEIQEAAAILAADPKYGEPLRTGQAQFSAGMPGVLDFTAPAGTPERLDAVPIGGSPPEKRTIPVVVHYRNAAPSAPRVGIFFVNMVDRKVEFGDAYIQACGGPPSQNCTPTTRGTQGSAWIDWPANNPVWRIFVIRPAASGGTDGMGVEIQSVDYKGKRVLKRGGVPILNVFYSGNRCGPYRDWLWSEDCFVANGNDLAPGVRWCATPAQTICDTANDNGNFKGVAIYEEGDELVMISECQAGWYRYVTGWRFHRDGILKPRFLYGYTEYSCVCNQRQHNAYWRLDLDLNGTGNQVVEEIENPLRDPRARWELITLESKRFRRPGRDVRWRVRNTVSGEIAEIIPGKQDGYTHLAGYTSGGNPFFTGKGDLWVLRYKSQGGQDAEIDDSQYGYSAVIKIDNFVNGESVVNQNVVIWYGAHLLKAGADPFHCEPLGPDIVLQNW